MGKKVLSECKLLHLARGPHSKVHIQSWSLFSIIEIVFKDIYKLKLPHDIKVYPISMFEH